MLTRLIRAVTLSSLLILAAATTIFAQDTAPYCEQLEAADCALLNKSAEAMLDISSMNTNSSMSFNLKDIPDMPFEELGIDYFQNSAYTISPEGMNFIDELREMSPVELEKMFDNPFTALDFLEELLTSINMSVEMDLEISDDVRAFVNEDFRAETGFDLPDDIGLQLRFIDGIIYADLSMLTTMIPEMAMFVQDWVGVDSAPLMQLARTEMTNAGLDESMSLGGGSELEGNPFASMSMDQAGPLMTQVGRLDPSGDVYTYLNIEKLAESANAVSFTTSMDYDAFMKTNAFRDLVYTIMIENGDTVTAQELDETVNLAQIMAPAFLKDLFLEFNEVIEPETGYMTAGTLTFDLDLDSLLTLASQNNPSLKLDPEAEPNMSFNILTTNSSINEDITIQVPDGAFVVPMEMLMMFMNS